MSQSVPMTYKIFTDALGEHFDRSTGEVPATRCIRFVFDEKNWIDVSFDGHGDGIEIRGCDALLIVPNVSNYFGVRVRRREVL